MADKNSTDFKNHGKGLPNSEAMAKMAGWIFAAPERRSLKYTLAGKIGKAPLDIHYIARHSDVMDVLRGPLKVHVSLAHYDDLMKSATKSTPSGQLEFLLGAPTNMKTERWDILGSAFAVPPKMARTDTKIFEDIAQRAVDKAVDVVLRDVGKGGTFNAVKDYGYLVPYLAGIEMTGLSMPEKPSLILKAATAFRNKGKKDKFKAEGDTGQAAQLLLWSQMIFGHAFANVGDRMGLMRIGNCIATRQYMKYIRHSMSEAYIPPAGSLIARFKAVRHEFPNISDDAYAHHVASTVYEFAGTIVILAGTSFSNILSTIFEKNMEIGDYLALITDKDNLALDEAMRLTPTTGQLFRRVEKDFTLGDQSFKVGDMICLILAAAMRDPAVFPEPDTFSDFSTSAPKRDRINYLNFGANEIAKNPFNPQDGTHPCFGQYWARDLMHKMLQGLSLLPNLKPMGKMTHFVGMPDALPMAFTPPPAIMKAEEMQPEPAQNIYTICTEICGDPTEREALDTRVRKAIERLGNPADKDMRERLLATGCIHFISLTVIEGANEKEPSYLVMEMAADGDEDDVLQTICSHAGERIFPIFQIAGCVKKREHLIGHLQDHAVTLTQSAWPEFFSGKGRNGLGFNGTPGLSVQRIQAEEDLANFVGNKITELDREGAGSEAKSPQQILQEVRSELASPDLTTQAPEAARVLWTLENSKPPVFAETPDSPWNKGGGMMDNIAKLFPRAFLAYFGLLYLAVAAFTSFIIFGGKTTKAALCKAAEGCRFPGDTDGTNILPNPVNLSELSQIPDTAGTLFLYHSPINVLLGILAAFIFSIVMAIAATWLRKGTDKIFSYGFARMGHIFWFVLALVLFIGYHTAYPYLPESLQWKPLGRSGMDFYRIGIYHWLWAAGFTAIFTGSAIIGGRLRPSRSLAAILATFMMAITTLSIGTNQLRIMAVRNGDGGDYEILNRWGNTGLQDLIFYPLLIALILTAALYAFSLSFPRLNALKKMKQLLIAFAVFFVFIFTTSFIAWDSLAAMSKNAVPLALSWVLIPLLMATLFMSAYLAYNRYIIGKRYNYAAFWKQTLGLAALGSLLWHIPLWATTGAAKTAMAFTLAIPITLIVIAGFLALLAGMIRRSEKRNRPHDAEPETETIREIMARENQVVAQNHMTSVVRIIPEQFRRRFTLPLALNIILTGLTNHKSRPGFLGTVGTVHYARWVHLPKTNNYVFYSNYDGSFENYLEDFITKASFGLTGTWSHSVGFPESKLLFFKGAEDGDRFKRYARGSMIPTPFWFSAYPKITAEQIRRNALIRDGLARIDSPSDAEAWLDLFGSRTRPAHVIQAERVQTMVFSGAVKLKAGSCLVINSDVPDQISKPFKDWVRDVAPLITYGESSPTRRASYIAFANSGLIRLGLAHELTQATPWEGSEELTGLEKRNQFPPVLSLGMDSPTRQNVLGDTGVDAPEHWQWGSGESKAHAVLLVYAVDRPDLKKLIAEHAALIKTHGLSYEKIDFEELPDIGLATEPFGFVDGVSQPILRGTQRAANATDDSIHLVNPGEFILGYADDRDYYPPSPQVEAIRDAAHDLPATTREQPLLYPKFAAVGGNTLRDLGRNGSYLVIRQLEQDVEGFKRVTEEIAKPFCPVTRNTKKDQLRLKKTQKMIQAKMMGRWQDGTSLLENPVRIRRESGGKIDFEYREDLPEATPPPDEATPPPDSEKPPKKRPPLPDNEFLYGSDDPQGHACPFGSHIRRANPRDGLEPESKDALGITNRHRLLRRGRPYEQGNKKGTFFMCLNADIDRQFEFVQQTWVSSPKFHGLRSEVDPITGQGIHKGLAGDIYLAGEAKDNLEFTIQAEGQEIPIKGLKSFVTMRGGGYFFLPSRDALRFMSRE